eukprot:TRINITY_DN37107_c0_g1_i1.p1 TRINITY_DN37107_c0_g1~~TRINITY_DN37107_c0_g1_i1.p1  ORF type:complete len:409 (-),score=67.80 TRINITY_DN37107_c0_g1_i1:183-1409(-)
MANASRGIEDRIARGEYYDAQQMVKMLYRRLCSRGQIQGAQELCLKSARRFSDVGEHDLAADLGKDLVSTLEEFKISPSEEHFNHIEMIARHIPPYKALTQKYAFLHQALRWSTTVSPKGHPRLHRLAADAYRAEGEYGKSQGHFVFVGDGEGLAAMIREWRQRGYPNEHDLFSLRALLILLSLNDVSTARTYWDAISGVAMPRRCSPVQTEPTVQETASAASADAPGCSGAKTPAEADAATDREGSSSVNNSLLADAAKTDTVKLPSSGSAALAAFLADRKVATPSAEAAVKTSQEATSAAALETTATVMPSPSISPGTQSAGKSELPPPPEPPVQCGCFLLAAVEAKSLKFFHMVRTKYTLVLRRDPSFEAYLDEIEVRIFGATSQRGGFGALVDALLGSMGSASA